MVGDDLVRFDELTASTLVELVNHLMATATEDQMILREAELDSLFTLADMRVRFAENEEYDAFVEERALVQRAHDLVHADDPMSAAVQLEALISDMKARSAGSGPASADPAV